MSSRSTANKANPSEDKGSFGAGTLLRGCRRYPLVTFLFVLLAGGGAAAVWFFLPLPKWTAYTVLQIKSQPDYIIKAESGGEGEFTLYKQQQAAMIKSRPVLSAAAFHPEIGKSYTLRKDGIDPIVWLNNQLQVDFKMGPELMRVSLEGDNPEELTAIVEAITSHYLKDVVNRDKTQRLTRIEKLNKIYRDLEDTLKTRREKIAKVVESVGSDAPEARALQEKYRVEMISIFERDIIQLERDLVKFKTEEKSLRTRIDSGEQTISVAPEAVNTVLGADAHYLKLLEKQRTIQVGFDELKERVKMGVTLPSVTAKEKELALAKEEAERYAETQRPIIKAQLRENGLLREKQQYVETKKLVESMLDWKKELNVQVASLQGKDKETKKGHFDLEILRSQLTQTEKSADRIYQEIEALRPEFETQARVEMWEKPVAIAGIEGYRRLKYTLIGGLSVLLLGLGVVTALEHRNRRIIDADEVTSALGLRVIGTVPSLPRRALARGATLTNGRVPDWQLHLAECVDNTRTLLLHGLGGTLPVRTIMVTSATSGEGKTSLAGHLAVSLARAGFKTLLVDADIRRPSLHRVLGVPLGTGLSELLQGEATLEAVIQPTPAFGLSIIPAGRWHSRLPRLLAGNAWRDLKVELEAEFDYVVIDSSPLLPVADALLLARHVDGVVLSLLYDVSRLGAVAQAKERLSAVGTNILGVVINGTAANVYGNSYVHYRMSPDAVVEATKA